MPLTRLTMRANFLTSTYCKLWNKFPSSLRSCTNSDQFKAQLAKSVFVHLSISLTLADTELVETCEHWSGFYFMTESSLRSPSGILGFLLHLLLLHFLAGQRQYILSPSFLLVVDVPSLPFPWVTDQ